jgi:hypothetical protein
MAAQGQVGLSFKGELGGLVAGVVRDDAGGWADGRTGGRADGRMELGPCWSGHVGPEGSVTWPGD